MRRLVGALVMVLAMPGAASAATITRKTDTFGTSFTYEAAAGEANALTVDIDLKARKATFTDTGATITAPAACTVSGAVATCPASATVTLSKVTLADGDDSFTDVADPVDLDIDIRSVEAGPGNDSVDAAAAEVSGGDGDDHLTGDGFLTNFFGGPGADTLRGASDGQEFEGGPGVDIIDGGGEPQQQVSYAGEIQPIVADLNQGTMGPVGEEDTVTRVSGVVGGKGDDVITGNSAGNRIEGGDGDDTIAGGGGQDDLVPGHGSDLVDGGSGKDVIVEARGEMTPDAVLDGGAGPDEILARSSAATVLGGAGNDRLRFDSDNVRVDGGVGDDLLRDHRGLTDSKGITCGEGNDVAVDFGKAVVPADCESIEFFSSKTQVQIENAVTLDRTGVVVEVPHLCRKTCAIRVDLFANDRRVARQRVPVVANRNGRATFALKTSARRSLERAGEATFLFSPIGVSDIAAAYATINLE